MRKMWVLFLIGGVVISGCSLWRTRVAMPTFSPGGGVYTNSVTVSVQCSTDDAEIMIKRRVSFHTNVDITLPPAVVTEDEWTTYLSPVTFRTNVYVLTRVTLSAYGEKEGVKVSETNVATYELRK